jgi:hypothetical protein
MDPHRRTSLARIVRAGIAPVLMASIFWAVTLAVCPQIHEWIHPDADHQDHNCAVTLFSNGGIAFHAIDLVQVERPSEQGWFGVIWLCSQVLVSTRVDQLKPERGPPGSTHG